MPTGAEIKKALKEAGLEVYRTRGDVVYLADRVRENLLMDAGTFIRGASVTLPPDTDPDPSPRPLRVGFVVRAQRSDFPHDAEEHLFERARRMAGPAAERGYVEVLAEVRTVLDPGDGERTLDTWCEVSFEKEVGELGEAVSEARYALSLEKAAAPTRGS
jgi:hypothetical protein